MFTVNLISFLSFCDLFCVFLVAVVGTPSGINQAVIRSLSSAIVGADEQGIVLKIYNSIREREKHHKKESTKMMNCYGFGHGRMEKS